MDHNTLTIDKLVHNKLVNSGKILFDQTIFNYTLYFIKHMRLRKNKQTKHYDRDCHNCYTKGRDCYNIKDFYNKYIILCIDCLNMFKKFQHINKYDFYGHNNSILVNGYWYHTNIYKIKQYEWRYYIIDKSTIVKFEQTYLYPPSGESSRLHRSANPLSKISRKATTDMEVNKIALYRLNTIYLILKELTINDIATTIARIYVRLIKWR
jgi:hypothetical protein